jgi:hypothetical protein
MAPPPEPTSPDVNDIYPELTGRVESPYWDAGDWTVSRADDVELFSILASGSGLIWQRRVRDAQRHGETLPLKGTTPSAVRPR